MEIEEEGESTKMMVDTPEGEPEANVASEEEEARQAIDMLRGDDVSGRVAAANRLEAVAAALGEERTRDVSLIKRNFCCDSMLLFTLYFHPFLGTASISHRWSRR